MLYTPLTIKAMQIAYKAHHGQFDISGVPYIFHPCHLAEQMEDEISICVALLHDVLEDTDITDKELTSEFPEEVMEPLRLLTHEKAVPYKEYIQKLKNHPVAKQVKIADLNHNSDFTRIKGIEGYEEHVECWRQKYQEARKILEE